MTILEISQVSKTFAGAKGGTVALQATDLSVAENDFITILGPSACAKKACRWPSSMRLRNLSSRKWA